MRLRQALPLVIPAAALVLAVGLVLVSLSSAPPTGRSQGTLPGHGPSQAAGLTGTPPTPPTTSPTTSPVATPARPTPTTGAQSAIPAFDHVFLLVMENQEASAVIGNPSAPYLNSLAERYGLATDELAVAHPSEPNYLALWSGSTQGIRDDRIHDFIVGQTLADQVEAQGRSWHVAAQNVPLGCYRGATASGGPDGPGTYARKHEPAISWTSVSGDPARCANITDFSRFDPTLGDLWLIVPNLCNDMHDCSIATGDRFLERFLPRILDSPAFERGVVFLTFDEGASDIGGGGRVATLVISPLARSGFTSNVRHTHYSLLRTIEAAWSMPCLASACEANDLREFFP